MKQIGAVIIVLLLVVSCGGPKNKKLMSEYEAAVYDETLREVKELEVRLPDLSSATMEDVQLFLDEIRVLEYEYDTTDMSDAGKEACLELEKRVIVLKQEAEAAATQRLRTMLITIELNDDCLIESTTTYPVYLEKGDILYYRIGFQKNSTVKIYNADARTLLNTYSSKTAVYDSLLVTNKGIYLIEVSPGGTQYSSVDISYRMAEHIHPIKTVKSEEIESSAGDFRVMSNKGVVLRSAFDQPRKFTLSSQIKSSFSGAAKSIALVAVQIPSGATEVLYNLRISTSEQDRSSDGKFQDNMNISYKKVRFLGLPLYESSRGSGLFSSLLDENRPLREEDAYCNMYVFRSQSAAKQFQDGTKKASELSYDVDYSTIGTQSCNGRIPTRGARTIYLAFENERVRFSNYIWVEVLTATPTTEYHTTKYFVE